jgi:hypothetical protein
MLKTPHLLGTVYVKLTRATVHSYTRTASILRLTTTRHMVVFAHSDILKHSSILHSLTASKTKAKSQRSASPHTTTELARALRLLSMSQITT